MMSKLFTKNCPLLRHILPTHGRNRSSVIAKIFVHNKHHDVRLIRSFSHSVIRYSAISLQDFYFKWIKHEDFDEFVDIMMKHYVPRNELFVAMGIEARDPSVKRLIERRVKRWIDSGASFSLVHKSTEEVAAFVLHEIATREKRFLYMEKDVETYSKPVKNMQKLLDLLERRSTVFDDPSINKILCGAAGGVTPKFQGLGFVTVYTEKQKEICRSFGCDGLIGEAITIKTQKVCEKFGFKEVGSVNYEDFEIDGKKVINMEALKGTTRAVVYWLDLRK